MNRGAGAAHRGGGDASGGERSEPPGIAIGGEPPLQQCERRGLCLEAFAVSVRGVLVVPGTDAVFVQSGPGKFRSGIQPAIKRDIGMPDDVDRTDTGMASKDVLGEFDEQFNLFGVVIVKLAAIFGSARFVTRSHGDAT